MLALICQRKKRSSVIVFMLALLFLVLIATLFVNLSRANPMYIESISPPSAVKPAIISFNPLIDKIVYAQNEISVTLNVSIPKTEAITKYSLYINNVQLQRDWNDSFVRVFSWGGSGPLTTDFYGNLTLKDIPEGHHNVTFIANMHGGYFDWATATSYNFKLTSYSTLSFSIDTASPTVLVLSMENRTFEIVDVPLNFSVNEVIAEVTYSLDGQSNVTVAGNTTLSGLSFGVHNVTVYAWDTAGNVGASETTAFTVAEPEPFPVAPVVAASSASVAVVCGALLVYFKKRKH
jgi:hypothetical protein